MDKAEMIDKRFGRWVVKEEYGRDKYSGLLLRCVCDCGTERIVKGYSLRSGKSKSCGCLHRERVSAQVGNKNPHWRGGCYINDAGYIMIYSPGHHRASSNGYVREHIVLAEEALGKPLPAGAQVHHYGETGDNSKIVLCQDQNYHYLLHIRERALADCGNANYRKCQFCKQYDKLENLYIRQRKSEGWIVYHRECLNKDRRKRVATKCSS